jgi:ABC-type transporter Mla MlaB component
VRPPSAAADKAFGERNKGLRTSMSMFSKPPTKKPGAAAVRQGRPAAPGRPPSAREVANHAAVKAEYGGDARPVDPADITLTGSSLIDWSSPSHPSFEVVQANPGLCAVLEDAALRYASGHAAQARELLEQGVQSDHDTKLSPLAWLALFDLQQRAGDRTAFDQFALQYVVQFERSAPPWEAAAKPVAGPRAVAGGYVALTGKLTATAATQLEALKRAMAKQVPEVRLDLLSVTGFDDEGARLLATALGDARRRKFNLHLQRVEKLKPMLDALVKKGRDGGEGAWLLSLELLQWSNAHAAFEDRAVEYAVTFELSPPSWEPPPLPSDAAAPADAGAEAAQGESETLCWSGVMTGSASPQLGRLAEYAHSHAVVPVDLTQVDRIDFVCAGTLLNTINRIETQRKAVQLMGASPIIRALLLLIGISPRHFVKKAQ